MRSNIGNHKRIWSLGIGACFALGGLACSEEDYVPPVPDTSGGSGGSSDSSNGGDGGVTAAAGDNSGGTGGEAVPATDSPDTIVNLNADIEGWAVAYTAPTSLTAPATATDTPATVDAGVAVVDDPDAGADAGLDASLPPTVALLPPPPAVDSQFAFVVHDPAEGDPVAGSMEINVPFDPAVLPPADDPFYKVGVERRFDPPLDFTGGSRLEVRARLNAGIFSSADTPPQIKIYIRTGAAGEQGIYANSGFNLEDGQRGNWRTYSFLLTNPGYQEAGDLDLTSVSTIGIEIASGAGTVVTPGTLHVDSFVLTN